MFKSLCQLPDALADESPIGLELCFARSTQANTAFLALEVGPAAHQARRQVFQLRKLDLQLALEAARTLRKNIKNQSGTIEYATSEFFLQIALLARIERRR